MGTCEVYTNSQCSEEEEEKLDFSTQYLIILMKLRYKG